MTDNAPDKRKNNLDAIEGHKLTTTEAIRVLNGESLADIRDEQPILDRRRSSYESLPIDQWPNFQIVWDLTPENFHFSLNEKSIDDFNALYPEGVCLRYVILEELDEKTGDEVLRSSDIWDVHDGDKLANAIGRWSEGEPITPPLVGINGRKLMVLGGNHRLAVCRARKLQSVPVLIDCRKVDQAQTFASLSLEPIKPGPLKSENTNQ